MSVRWLDSDVLYMVTSLPYSVLAIFSVIPFAILWKLIWQLVEEDFSVRYSWDWVSSVWSAAMQKPLWKQYLNGHLLFELYIRLPKKVFSMYWCLLCELLKCRFWSPVVRNLDQVCGVVCFVFSILLTNATIACFICLYNIAVVSCWTWTWS